MSKIFYIVLIVSFLFFCFFVRSSLAQTNLTVSIQVGDTIMTFSGKVSPNAQVSFLENGSVLGTVVADAEGNFSKSLLSQTPGIHNYALYVTDSNGKVSSTVNYSVSLTIGTETTLSNIILPPTINLSETEIGKGDTFKLSGLTVISSTVTLFINGTSHTYSVSKSTTADSSGYWEYNYNTSDLAIGEYNVYVKASATDGYQSESSEIKNFKIKTASTSTSTSIVTATPSLASPTTVISTGPVGKIICLLPSLIRDLYDPNINCRIEREEIFTVVKFWTEEWRGFIREIYAAGLEGEAKDFQNCDFNHDNACSLTDLSILLFYIEN